MIKISHLTKRYGDHLTVSDLSFTVDSGQDAELSAYIRVGEPQIGYKVFSGS